MPSNFTRVCRGQKNEKRKKRGDPNRLKKPIEVKVPWVTLFLVCTPYWTVIYQIYSVQEQTFPERRTSSLGPLP